MWLSRTTCRVTVTSLEEVHIAPVIHFMTIRKLSMGGQKLLKGNICHIPVDVSPTINSYPH